MVRKVLFLLVLLVFSALFVQGAVVIYTSPDIQVTLLSQDPDPVEPGQTVKVKFKVENNGAESDVDMIIKLTPKFPFSLYGDKAEKNVGKMRAGQTGADAAIVTYTLKVDEKATEEETELELAVQVSETGYVYYADNEFMIDIQTHDAVLEIASITAEPKEIPPGDTGKIKILVKNLADSLLKDIKFKLDLRGSSVPLAPYQSSSERRIAQLQKGYQKSLVFNLISSPSATPGLYKIPLNITYNDERGTAYTVEDTLAVVIGEQPKVRAYIKKSSVLQANKNGKITLEIANAGTTDVKFLELFLLPSSAYQLISTSNYFYIGDVDSDDTESEEISIFINRKAKTLPFPVKLVYYDANNKPYQQIFNLTLGLHSSRTLRKFGLGEKSKAGTYGVVLVLLGLGYLYYRKRKKVK